MSQEYTTFFSETNRVIYHGSNCAIPNPKILIHGYIKDFGYAFYCTDFLAQAKKWAATRKGDSVVNVYEYSSQPSLQILSFPNMTEEWLDFIVDCRRDLKHDYDIIEGPMADDQIWDYVDDLATGAITRQAFWEYNKIFGKSLELRSCSLLALNMPKIVY